MASFWTSDLIRQLLSAERALNPEASSNADVLIWLVMAPLYIRSQHALSGVVADGNGEQVSNSEAEQK